MEVGSLTKAPVSVQQVADVDDVDAQAQRMLVPVAAILRIEIDVLGNVQIKMLVERDQGH